ncbi:MAG: phosphatidate cytidylyltransferase [Gammaproteobacteria bacterium]|nr:phosphatidate cytidylyltransferase [Gammaproteobacteria bacterium]
MAGLAVKANVLWVFAAVCGALLCASAFSMWLARRDIGGGYGELRQRIRSWWFMVAAFAAALALHRNLTLVFFAFVSFLALKEYLSLIPTRRSDRRVLFWAYLTIPFQYLWIGMEWYGLFIIFLPVYAFLLLPLRMVLVGETAEFLRAAGTLHWGLMTTVFSISHVAFLLVLPVYRNPVAGGAGLVLFLVLLTEANDIAQYLWGKSLGRRRILPRVSPNKTWAGFLGGVGTTTVLAIGLAPYLTPLLPKYAALAGLLIGVAGFVGDVVISAVKRDIGVKDSGALIPGHGGILDRIDSLTYTAPLLFHYLRYLYF